MITKKFNPLVSIVIPVFNGANYMREAIDSAVNQTYKNIEVIVIDDGSTDETENIAKSYGNKIKYIKKENGGVASALNLGIKKANGEYISWLSHDDSYKKEKIFKQINRLKKLSPKQRKHAILYSNYEIIDKNSNKTFSIQWESDFDLEKLDKPIFSLFHGLIHGCTLLIPKVCFEEVSFFDERLFTTQDYALWLKMFPKYKLIFQSQLLINSRSHDEQGSKNLSELHMSEANLLWTKAIENLSSRDLARANLKEFDFFIQLYKHFNQNKLVKPAKKAFLRAVNPKNGKKNLLIVTATLDGGLGKYIHDLNLMLSKEFNVYIFHVKNLDITVYYNLTKIFSISLNETITFKKMFYENEASEILKLIISLLDINLIQVNGFFYIGFHIIEIAKIEKIPIVYTAHDFSLLCLSLFFLNDKSEYCSMTKNLSRCNLCLKNNRYTNWLKINNTDSLLYYRNYIKHFVISNLDHIVFPTNFVRNSFLNFYPKIQLKKTTIIEHGIKKNYSNNFIKSNHLKLKIGIIGDIREHKGISILEKIINSLSPDKFEFTLFGKSAKPHKLLRIIEISNYNEITSLLKRNNISIVLILSKAPETFSYVLSESWSATIPVIATNIGALKERINKTDGGFLISYNNMVDDVVNLLNKIISNPQILIDKIENVKKIKQKSLKEMGREYSVLYNNLINLKNNDSTLNMRGLHFELMKECTIQNLFSRNKMTFAAKEKLILDKIYLTPVLGHLFVRLYLRIKKIIGTYEE